MANGDADRNAPLLGGARRPNRPRRRFQAPSCACSSPREWSPMQQKVGAVLCLSMFLVVVILFSVSFDTVEVTEYGLVSHVLGVWRDAGYWRGSVVPCCDPSALLLTTHSCTTRTPARPT